MKENQIIKSKVIDYIISVKESLVEDYIDLTALEVGKSLEIKGSYRAISRAMFDEQLEEMLILNQALDANLSSTTNVRYYKMKKNETLNKNKNYNFRKIKAKEKKYIQSREENDEYLQPFKSFLELETIYNKQSKDAKSGMASSYSNYLIKILVIINESYFEKLDINSVEFINEIKLIQQLDEFKIYNEEENRYPNATINAYLKFWFEKAFEEDDFYDDSRNTVTKIKEYEEYNPHTGPEERPNKVQLRGRYTYVRNSSVTEYVKVSANWKCELNPVHNTFISKYNEMPYVEAHHLIPMKLQDNFEYSLDVPANVVSLCPNCHRLVHHGIKTEKSKILISLYNQRKNDLVLAGIEMSMNDLLTMYE